MSLTLYMHPLSSYCWKALTALYENGTPFTPVVVDLGDPTSRAAFLKVWPIGKFPVLRDDAHAQTIPESSIIIEYIAAKYPSRAQLLPSDADRARQVRLRDRFFDLYVHGPMQAIVGDRLRPADRRDEIGVAQARATLDTAYAMTEQDMATKTWATGDSFTMADCAAAPALHYANRVHPFGAAHEHLKAYLRRLEARPSFARVIEEARPYAAMFPA